MTTALEPLVAGLVDYAGLFPPAALPLPQVVANYQAYRQSNPLEMLGRLIVPAGRLQELAEQLPADISNGDPWRISALLPPIEEDGQAAAAGLGQIEAFHASAMVGGRARVDTVEVRVPALSGLTILEELLPEAITAYVEVDWQEDPRPWMAALAATGESGLRGKIRTGGVTSELIPPSEAVARFLLAAGQHRVGIKATAGLHHPLTGEYRLTYEPDAALGTMFGFVNVFVAGLLAFDRPQSAPAELIAILESRQGSDFTLTDQSIGFGDWQIEAARISQLRQNSLISFGSCSFTEPTSELPVSFGL